MLLLFKIWASVFILSMVSDLSTRIMVVCHKETRKTLGFIAVQSHNSFLVFVTEPGKPPLLPLSTFALSGLYS